jgi:hypothetical protein
MAHGPDGFVKRVGLVGDQCDTRRWVGVRHVAETQIVRRLNASPTTIKNLWEFGGRSTQFRAAGTELGTVLS